MFKVRFRKQIHGCCAGASSRDVLLERLEDVPFVPVKGMYFVRGDWEAQAVEVLWMLDESVFHVWTEANKEIYNAQLNNQKHRPIEEIVADYVNYGWHVDRLVP